MNERLKKQIEFILEVDKMKEIIRITYTLNQVRYENDAEHSWHLAMMVAILSEHCKEKVDLVKTMKMVLIHDIVEIDAGDTFAYNEKANEDKEEREIKAADRIFNILPEDQAKEFRNLWDEFEERKTPESKFAVAMDRLQPLLLNYHGQGKIWKEKEITKDQVIERNIKIKDFSEELWGYAKSLIDDAVKQGWLKDA